MKLKKVKDLELPFEIRDATFLDENLLLALTSKVDLWKISLDSQQGFSQFICSGEKLLQPVAQSLGQTRINPAEGAYPQLALSPQKDLVVVNSHDCVLAGVKFAQAEASRLIAAIWGEYYPRLQFSSDGSLFLAHADTALVFETQNWKYYSSEEWKICAWHPTQPIVLTLNEKNQMQWINFEYGLHSPQSDLLGSIDESQEPIGLALDAEGESCILVLENGTITGWLLNPIQRLWTLHEEERIDQFSSSPNGRWVAVGNKKRVRLWSIETQKPLSQLLPGNSLVRFSPSGSCLLATSLSSSSNPYPSELSHKPKQVSIVSLWKIY